MRHLVNKLDLSYCKLVRQSSFRSIKDFALYLTSPQLEYFEICNTLEIPFLLLGYMV